MRNKVVLAFYIMLFSMLLSFPSAYANRIKAQTEPSARCMSRATDAKKCKSKRDKALQRGCITGEEHSTLIRFNSYPNCDWDEKGLSQLQSWCPCGCLHPDTNLAVEDALQPNDIFETAANHVAYNKSRYNVITVHEKASIGSPHFPLQSQRIDLTTVGKAFKPLVLIQMKDGRELKLTQNHPVVLANGRIKVAKNLQTTDQILDINGTSQPIRKLEHLIYQGAVVNLATAAPSVNGHIIFANGLAVGDLTLEAWLRNLEQSMALRR